MSDSYLNQWLAKNGFTKQTKRQRKKERKTKKKGKSKRATKPKKTQGTTTFESMFEQPEINFEDNINNAEKQISGIITDFKAKKEELKSSPIGKLVSKKVEQRRKRKEADQTLIDFGKDTGKKKFLKRSDDPLEDFGLTHGHGVHKKESAFSKIKSRVGLKKN